MKATTSRTLLALTTGCTLSFVLFLATRVNSGIYVFMSRLEAPGVIGSLVVYSILHLAPPWLRAITTLANGLFYSLLVWIALAARSAAKRE